MILAAGGLVLLGAGLFVAGIQTGIDALYWGCVAVCVAAALLLFVARRRITATTRTGPASSTSTSTSTPTSAPATAGAAVGEGEGTAATTDSPPADSAAATTGDAGETPAADAPAEDLPDPDVEDVEVTDLLLVVDLKDEVLVVDEHPRYHLEGCVHLRGRTPIPLPVDEARTDGFTPCAACTPDRTIADRARARKAGRAG